jgi:hypothetical protein
MDTPSDETKRVLPTMPPSVNVTEGIDLERAYETLIAAGVSEKLKQLRRTRNEVTQRE